MTGNTNPVWSGIRKGMTIALTGRRPQRTPAPQPLTAMELQERSWRMVGDALRRAMAERPNSDR